MKRLLVLLLLASAPAHAQSTPPVPLRLEPVPPPSQVRLPDAPGLEGFLTVEEAVRLALERQPDLRIPAAEVKAARGRTTQARSGLLPQIDLNTSYTGQDPLSGTSDERVRLFGGTQASLILNQLLWDFHRTSSRVGANRSREAAREADLAAARANVERDVRQAFHGFVAATDLAEVARMNLENQRRNVALATARWESGLGLPADVVRAQTAVATSTVSLNAASAQAANARVRLARQMGLDPRTPLQPAPVPMPEGAQGDLNAVIEQALQRRPEMQAAGREVEAARYALRAAHAANAPALSANAGLTSRGQNYPPESWFVQYGLSLTWPVFDAGLTAGLVEEAEGLLEAAEADLEVQRMDVVEEVVQAHVQLQTALDSLVAAAAGEANARESVRIAEGRYAAGLGSFLEVLDAQAALLNASNQHVQARLAAHTARAAFDRAAGLP